MLSCLPDYQAMRKGASVPITTYLIDMYSIPSVEQLEGDTGEDDATIDD